MYVVQKRNRKYVVNIVAKHLAKSLRHFYHIFGIRILVDLGAENRMASIWSLKLLNSWKKRIDKESRCWLPGAGVQAGTGKMLVK